MLSRRWPSAAGGLPPSGAEDLDPVAVGTPVSQRLGHRLDQTVDRRGPRCRRSRTSAQPPTVWVAGTGGFGARSRRVPRTEPIECRESQALFHVDLMDGPTGTESQANRPSSSSPPRHMTMSLKQTRRSRSACAGPLAVAGAGHLMRQVARAAQGRKPRPGRGARPRSRARGGFGAGRGLGAQRGHRAGDARRRAARA